MAHVTEPLHSPDAYHSYKLSDFGCTRFPNGSQNGVQVVDEAIPKEYIGVWLSGGTVESIFFKVRNTMASEFRALCELHGRDVARQHFGGSIGLKRFTDRVMVGTLPITTTTLEFVSDICREDNLLETDGQIFLVMLLLFGEDVISKARPE